MADIVITGGPDTAINIWDPNSGAALPAYLAEALGDLGSNIADRMTVHTLSYEGKTWSIVKDGNKTKLQAKNADGDMLPIPVMRVVILNYNPDRGRSYYPGVYNPAASAAPTCWSPDGKAPDASVKEKQSATCANCPQSVKGSKVQEGKEMVACSSHRMVAVAPAFDLMADPLRLKIAVTSDYDKEIVEHGWYALRQYTDWLKSRGVAHTGLVVTKMKFDPNTAYPKILFALDRVLTVEEVGQIKQALANPKVAELLAEKWSAAGSAGTLINDADIKPHGLEGAYADGWVAHPDSAGYSYKGQEVLANDVLAARYPAPEPVIPAIPASEQVIENPPQVPAAPVVEAAPPPASVHDPLANAAANGWLAHPTAPGYWYLGQEVILEADLVARYPAPAAEPIVAAAPPPPPPAPTSAPVVVDPMEAARADGWIVHPTAPGYHYKGQEVVLDTDVAAKYVGNGASAGASVPDPTPTGSAQTAATTTSPTDASAIPADVQSLLDKWAG